MPRISGGGLFLWKSQPDATLTQAAPVQNTWYEVLAETKNGRIEAAEVEVADANETLEMRVTVDDKTPMVDAQAAVAGTPYFLQRLETTPDSIQLTTSGRLTYRAFQFEGHTVKVEVRKTTATGAGTITAFVKYDKKLAA